MTAAEKFQALLRVHTRYDAEAYNFIYEALDWTHKHVAKEKQNQHVSARELCEGFRQYAIKQFGSLALTVLEGWNIHSTDDIGSIVFNLVEFDLMGKQDSDSQDDFHALYNFVKEFTLCPIFSFNHSENEWETKYVKHSKKGNSSSRKK